MLSHMLSYMYVVGIGCQPLITFIVSLSVSCHGQLPKWPHQHGIANKHAYFPADDKKVQA